MRAFALPEQGAGPVVSEVETPQPAAGEVLVRVRSSSVNGFDLAVAAGHLAGMMEHRYPVVLGKDFAGTVEAVGEGVTRFTAGESVYGVVTKAHLGEGAFADFVTVSDAVGIAALPEGVNTASAGAVGLAGTAALDALATTAPRAGETILVSGATGGVGAIAVQYAVAAGTRVIATARPGEEEAFVRRLGAHEAVDHTSDLAAQVRALAPEGVDVILHLAGDGPSLARLLAEKGRIASLLGFGADQHPAATFVLATPVTETLDRLAGDLAAGLLTVPIARTYPLAELPSAFGNFAGGTLGKIAVSVSS